MAENQKNSEESTDFGFERVPLEGKTLRVGAVFDSVADKYNLMNDLMSFGMHRIWKRFALSKTALRSGGFALDVAAGSGDLSKGMARQVGPNGLVVVTDINSKMLHKGRDFLTDAGFAGNISYAQADAEKLPFGGHQFDCVTIGFGLRNVTNKSAALADMYRVLKPGGQLLILEFSEPTSKVFSRLYQLYFKNILPRLGALLSRADAYRYLPESVEHFPPRNEICHLMIDSGFEKAEVYDFTFGICSIFVGYN